MQKNNLSILCISCDKNLIVFKNFERFFNKYWNSCVFDKYVLFEDTKIENTSFNIINSKGDFSSRIINALNQIDNDFVLIFLDDFFIESPVNESKIQEYLEAMEKDNTIANIGFSQFEYQSSNESNVKGTYLRPHKGYSLMNYQVGLWNRKTLLNILKSGEDPWYSEWYGTSRAIRSKNKFYGLLKDTPSIIDYSKGWVVVRGMWNLEEVKRIEEKTSIKIDIGNLPTKVKIDAIPMSFAKKVATKIRIYSYKFRMLFRRKRVL